ncbi:hypothetical protein [Nocardia sp. NPDC050406]|uniref:hypothetical protein n=1 Tax=Nocardia sp. NPDC050406 TaxID=3364318 RepID=UPI0037B5B083
MTTAQPMFRGDFEAHLTVRADDPDSIDAFETYAAAQGLKFIHIVLARGRTPGQPMVTVRSSGTYAAVRDSVDKLASRFAVDGFPVVRVKIEATPWTEGVPDSDERARALGEHYYFEHHVKLLLPQDYDTTALATVAEPHSAHVSVNARRTRPDGRAERFITQRCRLVGTPTAQSRLDSLLTALRAADLDIASVEREFVVYDSDESLDAGWIVEERP